MSGSGKNCREEALASTRKLAGSALDHLKQWCQSPPRKSVLPVTAMKPNVELCGVCVCRK